MEPCPADTPEKLPSMILWTLCLVLKCIYICLWTIKTPEMRKPLAATVQKLCKTLVYRFCKIVHYFQWIQRPVIISILLVIMLPFFLYIVRQQRDPKMQPRAQQLLLGFHFQSMRQASGTLWLEPFTLVQIPNSHSLGLKTVNSSVTEMEITFAEHSSAFE